MDRNGLIRALRRDGIRDERVLAAMQNVPRDQFVPPEQRGSAWENRPLPIGSGQTISQPFVVALMSQLLQLRDGDEVLDVGTGCGYQAAVLVELGARVCGVERLPELAARANATLARLGYDVDVLVGDGRSGRPDRAPFDAIVVAAASPDVPAALTGQLRSPGEATPGGRLVIPVASGDPGVQRLHLLTRTPAGINDDTLLAVRFVPLIGSDPD